MDFGIVLATSGDSWRTAERAEALGFSHVWFYDTQMLAADCFVAMGAAALKTERIRLGTGVLVPTNRIAPVTANAFATLNQMAPGRLDFGVGTGFTARRAMGMGAMKLADFEEHIRVVMGLLRDETLQTEMEGEMRTLRFLNADLGLINTRDPVRLHVSAFGPRSRRLTAALKAAWINFFGDVPAGVAALRDMQASWSAAGHAPSDLYATAFTVGCVLRDGEPADSERVVAQAGPRAAVTLHRAADLALAGLPNTSPLPPSCLDTIAAYVDTMRGIDPATRHLENHRGHLLFVKDEERPFITADLIRETTFSAPEAAIKQRIEALRDAGYTQFAVQLMPGQEDAIEDWARIKAAFA